MAGNRLCKTRPWGKKTHHRLGIFCCFISLLLWIYLHVVFLGSCGLPVCMAEDNVLHRITGGVGGI